MVNTNPEKIMSRILGTQTTRKARPVRRRMLRQNKTKFHEFAEDDYFIIITPQNLKDLLVGFWSFKTLKEFTDEHGTHYGDLFGINEHMLIENKDMVMKYKKDLLTEEEARKTKKDVLHIFGHPTMGDSVILISPRAFVSGDI